MVSFPLKRRAVALMALLFFGLIPGSAWTQETPVAKELEQNLEPLADAELLGDWRGYQHAINQGNGTSAFFTERGPKRAEAWKQLAEGNSAMGMVLVGKCYQTGIGVAKDEKKAFAMFTKAADLGNTDSIILLALCYQDGYGVAKDGKKAFLLYSKAAILGNSQAICNLGNCYKDGIGVSKDKKKAFELYSKAADLGYASAMNSLGLCYEDNLGVNQDLALAVQWYRKAATQGDEDAKKNLSRLGQVNPATSSLTAPMKPVSIVPEKQMPKLDQKKSQYDAPVVSTVPEKPKPKQTASAVIVANSLWVGRESGSGFVMKMEIIKVQDNQFSGKLHWLRGDKLTMTVRMTGKITDDNKVMFSWDQGDIEFGKGCLPAIHTGTIYFDDDVTEMRGRWTFTRRSGSGSFSLKLR